jgi:hypothetical protein
MIGKWWLIGYKLGIYTYLYYLLGIMITSDKPEDWETYQPPSIMG